MTTEDLKYFVVSAEATIRKALEFINQNKKGIIFIADQNNRIVALATDGDIRRGLLKNNDMDAKISSVMNSSFVSVDTNTSREKILKMLDHKIHVIPVVGAGGELKDVITRENFPLRPDKQIFARSKSPVRISFGGGGSDLTHYFVDHKGVVINATISLYSRAALKKTSDGRITVHSEDLKKTLKARNLADLVAQEKEMSLIVSLIKLIKPDYGFELTIESEYPVGSGLGGSAVVLSAIIGCFNQFREDKWDNYEMAEMAFQAERLSLNMAGGWQDQYATVFGGFNFMEFDKDKNIVHPLRVKQDTMLELEACLLLCNTGVVHQSGDIHVDQKKQMQSQEVIELVNQNKDLTYQIKNQLLRGQLQEFAKLLDRAWELKRQFSTKISTPDIDAIYDYARAHGALGGKLLGAGGGGYFLFFVNPFHRSALKKALTEKGLQTQAFTFDNTGLQAWSVRLEDSHEAHP